MENRYASPPRGLPSPRKNRSLPPHPRVGESHREGCAEIFVGLALAGDREMRDPKERRSLPVGTLYSICLPTIYIANLQAITNYWSPWQEHQMYYTAMAVFQSRLMLLPIALLARGQTYMTMNSNGKIIVTCCARINWLT